MNLLICASLLLTSLNVTPVYDGSDATVQTARYHGRRHHRTARVDESTAPFKNKPFWKCDVGSNPNPIHMDFTATPDSRIVGAYDQDDGKGGVETIELDAKYARLGKQVAIYTMGWVPVKRDPSSGPLGRSVWGPKLFMKLTFVGKGEDGKDNHWIGEIPEKSRVLKCTDHVKSGANDFD